MSADLIKQYLSQQDKLVKRPADHVADLMPYADGSQRVRRRDRDVAKDAKAVYDEVRLAAFKARGALELGAHVMDGVMELDEHRRELAGDDPVTVGLLAEIERQAINSAKAIQRNLYNRWGS